MRKTLATLVVMALAGASAQASCFNPGLMRDTFVGTWKVTVTPDDDAHQDGARTFADTLTFKGGQFTSAFLLKKGFASVEYSENVRMGDIGMFSAVQKSGANGTVKWAGKVSVNQMTGDLTWTNPSGTVEHYTISGTKQ